jgi:hypothetical protein
MTSAIWPLAWKTSRETFAEGRRHLEKGGLSFLSFMGSPQFVSKCIQLLLCKRIMRKSSRIKTRKQRRSVSSAGKAEAGQADLAANRTSWKKRTANYAGLLLITLILMESVSFIAYGIVTQQFFLFSDITAKRSQIIRNAPDDDGFEVAGLKIPWDVPIHPYYGFGRPGGFRFLQYPDDEIQNDPNGLIVAVTGGSVAFGLFNGQKETLQAYFESIPKFKGKNIHIVLLGYFAWKQPQQVTALSYYLAMGGKADIVINLDGHNEIVDANTNYKKGVYPAYPWLWDYLATNTVSAAEFRLIGEIRYRKTLRHSSAEIAEKAAYGVSANVIWYFFDQLFESGIEQRNARLANLKSNDQRTRPFRRYGPDRQFGSLRSALEFSTHIWKTSSIQLNRIMKGNGGDYFHFLQPNQYVPNSKPFTRKERQIAYDPRRARAIEIGYPYLIEASSELNFQEIEFFDLTTMFKEVNEAVYKDACCHLNKHGNELLARKIGATIVQHYAKYSKLPASPEK